MEKISLTDRVRNEVLNSQGGEECLTYTKNDGVLIGLVTSCVETAFWNTLLKEGRRRTKWREDEQE